MLSGTCSGGVAAIPAFGPDVYRNLRPMGVFFEQNPYRRRASGAFSHRKNQYGKLLRPHRPAANTNKEVCRRIWNF